MTSYLLKSRAGAIFITGTDTEVGKTYIASQIIAEIVRKGHTCCGFKPISAGARTDAKGLASVSFPIPESLDFINPYHFKTPASPLAIKSKNTGKKQKGLINKKSLIKIKNQFSIIKSQYDYVVIEGIGGWLAPLNKNLTNADLAKKFNLPIYIVANDKLGVLNHVLLTLESINNYDLECPAVILNKISKENNIPTNARNNKYCLEKMKIAPKIFIANFS